MNKKNILLIEDNRDDEELTLLAFEQSEIVNNIVVVRDGAEALDYLFGTGAYADQELALDEMPSLILLDLKLPKIDGLEVLQRLRADAKTNLIPVVVLTTSKEEQDVVNSYKFGCNSYVRKPVDFNEFLNATRQLGLYWLSLNEVIPE